MKDKGELQMGGSIYHRYLSVGLIYSTAANSLFIHPTITHLEIRRVKKDVNDFDLCVPRAVVST